MAGCGPCRWRRSAIATSMVVVFLMVGSIGTFARAADTVEVWDAGATDVDFYMGATRAGSKSDDLELSGEMMFGFGVNSNLSAYLGAALSAPGTMVGGEAAIFLGFYSNAFESEHFDLDVFLDFSSGGAGLSALQIAPSIELNVDAADDLSQYGCYLRAGAPVFGQPRGGGGGSASAQRFEATVALELNPGVYWAVLPGQHLLLEYDTVVHDEIEVGGVALGYNVVLSDETELITQIYGDIPQGDEPWAVGITLGFIGTIVQ